MSIWVDAQLSPALATWIRQQFGVEAEAVRDCGLRDSGDAQIFFAARDANAIVMSKDRDFVLLLDRHGPPPKLIWITCGNTSNRHLHDLLARSLPNALLLLQSGERMVEISDQW